MKLLLFIFSLSFITLAAFAQNNRPLDFNAMAQKEKAAGTSIDKTLPDNVRKQYEARQRREKLQGEINGLIRQLKQEPSAMKKIVIEKKLQEKLGESFDDNVVSALEQEKQLEESLKRIKAEVKKNAEKGARERFIQEIMSGITAPAPIVPDKEIETVEAGSEQPAPKAETKAPAKKGK